MKLQEITDQKAWDAFVSAQPYAQFSQSWAWGELQRARGREVKRFMVVEGEQGTRNKGQVACQFVRQPGKFGLGYWFATRGPVFGTEDVEKQKELMRAILHCVQNDKRFGGFTLFSRFEPAIVHRVDLTSLGFVRTHSMSPATTLDIDLRKSEEELLADMHPKTRYNIRVAQKHGVTVRLAKSEEDVQAFLRLMVETAERDGIVSQPLAYLRLTYEMLSKHGICRLRLAEYQGNILAANMDVLYGDTYTYLHGASSSEHRNVMAPYLLQWEAIQTARAEGHHFYDFWGCNPEDENDPYFKPRWQGITRFKRGWGGRITDYAGTWDLPRWPSVYRMVFRR